MWQCIGNKKISLPIKGTRSSFVLPPNFMSGSLQNTLSGTPAVALIPYLYNGSSRAASSFSMPGSEAIFHGFVCARFHLPSSLCQRPSCTLLFTAFMKLKLIYTLSDLCQEFFIQNGKKGVRLGSGSKDPMEPAGREMRICLLWQQKDAS